MPNTFNINVVTNTGKNLIAQATSTNQIVIVDALSSTNAATDAADLVSKDITFYNGVSGDIQASSATNNVAKVVSRFGNAGENRQIVKSVAIRGKLANQSDSEAVIMAAMSDPESEIYLPSNASPSQIVRFIFGFVVNADNTIETVYADGATMSDLERFVSMYKAGDPTSGDEQTILGKKTFNSMIAFNGNVLFDGCVQCEGNFSATAGFFIDSLSCSSAKISTELLPESTLSIDIGSTAYIWRNAYIGSIQFDGLESSDSDHVQLYEDDGDVWIQPASSGKVAIGKPGSLCNISAHNANLNNISCQDITGVDCNLRDITARDIDATTLQGVLETLYKNTPEAGSLAEIEISNATDSTSVTILRGSKVYDGEVISGPNKTITVTLDGVATTDKWVILNKCTFTNTSSKVLAVMVNDDV